MTGIITGYALLPSLKKPAALKLKLLNVAILLFLTVTSAYVVLDKIPNDRPKYDMKMKTTKTLEEKL